MGREDNLTPYEKSDAWRCPKAPVNPEFPLQVRFNTGAHHWIERWFGYKVGYAFMCQYCFDVRKYPKYNSTWRKDYEEVDISGSDNDNSYVKPRSRNKPTGRKAVRPGKQGGGSGEVSTSESIT